MLERLWREGNPSALLVGMQTGEATVENSMEFPHEIKNGTAKGMGVLRVQKGKIGTTVTT